MVDLCASLRAERKERWQKLGGIVGLSEWDIKGGAPQPAPAKPVPASDEVIPSEAPVEINESKNDAVLV